MTIRGENVGICSRTVMFCYGCDIFSVVFYFMRNIVINISAKLISYENNNESLVR
ncbi:MAG: hypothetical protein KAG34_12670 [Cocleimonas sp.]|nr:hypothetical protein [Cocleimonas sp.]